MDDKKPHRNWSITINDKEEKLTDKDLISAMPGWKLEGQWERGESGTRHFQGYLNTPPVRFNAVKRAYPTAHIEICRDVGALKSYVHKDDSRISTYEPTKVPSMFEFQTQVSAVWNWRDFSDYVEQQNKEALSAKEIKTIDDHAMGYLDMLVSEMIEEGALGLEFLAINPMWRSSWKKFWRAILKRNNTPKPVTNDIVIEVDAPSLSPPSQQTQSELPQDGGEINPPSEEQTSEESD